MNLGKSPLFILDQDCDQAALRAVQTMTDHGLHALRSFDLQSGQEKPCASRVVVLLVYGSEPAPWTLLLEGTGSRTCVYLESSPGSPDGPVDSLFAQTLARAFSP